MRKIFFGTIVTLLFLPFVGIAQMMADTSSVRGGLAKALSFYIQTVGINAALYTGRENADPRYPVNDGSPFLGTNEALPSEVLYDGILYKGVPMWYDIVRNEVAVRHPSVHARIALNSKRIGYFRLDTQLFVPASRDVPGAEKMPGGFYAVLHGGKTVLLGRYTKRMFEVINEGQYVTNYTKPQREYFLQKDGKYFPVKNLPSLLNVLGEKKQALQQHLREHEQYVKSEKIKVQDTPEQSMIRVLAYYEKISL